MDMDWLQRSQEIRDALRAIAKELARHNDREDERDRERRSKGL